MVVKKALTGTLYGALFISFLAFAPFALAESVSLMQGIEQYRHENYEEAIPLLLDARKAEPRSSLAAFFLGLAYKQVLDYPSALVHLQDAVTLHPRIKEAVVELIEVALQLNNLQTAKIWIQIAEREEIFAARVAFLKGLALKKEGKNMEAIASFEQAMAMDESLAQAAEVQIAMCYLEERKLQTAKDTFRTAVLLDPTSDLAAYARQYQDLVEERMVMERPLRVTLGAYGQYDTNVVLLPNERAFAPGITDEESAVLTTTARVDYVPVFEGPWLFNAQYAFLGSFYENYSTSHNYLSNGIYVTPGYNFGRYALNLAVNYNHYLVRDPSYKQYLDYLYAGPLLRMLLNRDHVLELFSGYVHQEYDEPPLIPQEDRDSDGFYGYLGWIWLYARGAFFSLRYEFSHDNTDGIHWENDGHRVLANITVPVVETLKLQVTGQAFFQRFQNTNSLFGVKREDDVYRGSLGLSWEFHKNTTLVLQVNVTQANSNIPIYDYDREVCTAGIEYRF
jgi:tetratricopeptide (TPR) repeat protein